MSTYYIIAVTKTGNSYESEITEYLVNTDGNSHSGTKYSKESFWEKVKTTYLNDTFYCFNIFYNTKKICKWEFDTSHPYLKTEPNSSMRDNLLSLPGIAD